jgi:LCP family protein required for cell wall assembly
MSSRPPAPRHRTWPQRLVLAIGVVVILGCGTAAAATAYFGLRFASIDRVANIALDAAAKGEPANYLIVGTDSRAGLDPDAADAGGLMADGEKGCNCTDTIMVVRVDPQARTANILSFPRDLWVPIAPKGNKARINSAYQRGEQALIDTIEENFDIAINHYVEIDFVGFQKLVDAVGGISLWFDRPVRDTHTGLSVPKAECQTLNGEQARRFVRSRYIQYRGKDGKWHQDPTADFGRITRQQIFIRQAISKAVAKGLGNPVTLNQLVSAGVDNVRLDEGLDAGDLLALGRQFSDFDSDSLVGYSIPTDSFRTSAGADVQMARMREAQPILNIFRGLPADSLTNQAIAVTVLNGTNIQHQASDVAGALLEIGFGVTDVGDYSQPVGRTTVLYGPGGDVAARQLARHVTGGAALVYDADVDADHVILVTGSDFTTVHDQLAPEGSSDDVMSSTTTTIPDPSAPSTTTSAPTTTTTIRGYATGEPPPGVTCS